MNTKNLFDQNASGVQKVLKGHVQFSHVTFTYPNATNPVLTDISFEVQPGQTVAIVGTTGAGKTTLTKS